ncbi:hypothetical protein C1646_771682 [Rhizophagus diaphanus]|nr:hypothetical protein C1646_771682 [Rhizophagus diaphanus] [Rhizophagus sp. MUCL 43196]
MWRTSIMRSIRRINSTHGMETICGISKNVHKKLILHGVSEVLEVSGVSQEFKEKLYSALKSKAEINDLSEKLVDKYNEREKEFENKASQLIASTTKVRFQLISEQKSHLESQRELEAKYTAEIKSLKSNIKTLKREATLTQKASFADKNVWKRE